MSSVARARRATENVQSTNIVLTIIHGDGRSIDRKSHVQYLKLKALKKQLLMNKITRILVYIFLKFSINAYPS